MQPVGARRESRPSRIARELLQRISTGKYPIGSRLPSERQLMEDFSVSRPVVREALSMISALDVVDIQMGRGAFVIAVPDGTLDSLNQSAGLLDVVNVREVLEAGALQFGPPVTGATPATVRYAPRWRSWLGPRRTARTPQSRTRPCTGPWSRLPGVLC